VSRENVEVQRLSVDAINDAELTDELLARFCTPDFAMANPATAVTERSYAGADGVRAWVEDFGEVFAGKPLMTIDEVIADGDDFVVSKLRLTGRGARSGAPLDLAWINVMWFRDGKMSRGAGYTNRRAALEAVGLEEPARG
jgi:ketosteroid isomerase-like protein